MCIREIPEFRRFDCSSVKEKIVDARESVESFLARGGKIQEIPLGVSSDIPIILSKQPDGTYKNDFHSQDKSRKRPRLSTTVIIFDQPKKKLSASKRMYIRVKEINGVTHYRSLIQGVAQSEWNPDIEVAIKARNESLGRRGELIPD